MRITPSQLRANIYNLLDAVIETGEPIEVLRKGVVVRLMPPAPRSWLDGLPRRNSIVVGDPDSIVEVDWAAEWSPEPL